MSVVLQNLTLDMDGYRYQCECGDTVSEALVLSVESTPRLSPLPPPLQRFCLVTLVFRGIMS